jgi:predicted transcriptional regulator
MRNPPRGMIRDYTLLTPALHPETSLMSAAADANWQEHTWLAVVDHENHLLGSVSRAKVFSSAGAHAEQARPATDILSALLSDVVHLFGQLLHGLLRGRRAS